jgi:two-component system LytT family response regulator
MRILIVDDERMARKRLRTLLAAEADVEIVGEASNGLDAVRAIGELAPDVVFLDVQMPELDGFAVVDRIGVERMPVVVFVTAFDAYALKAFEVHALDYLTKPFDRERFQATLRRAREHVQLRALHRTGGTSPAAAAAAGGLAAIDPELNRRLVALLEEMDRRKQVIGRILVKTGGRALFLRAAEIDWVEAAGNYVRLHIGRDVHTLHEGLSSIEAKLDPQHFLRIHRSTIVNVARIRELQPWFHGDSILILRDGTKLTVSRTYRDALKDRVQKRRVSSDGRRVSGEGLVGERRAGMPDRAPQSSIPTRRCGSLISCRLPVARRPTLVAIATAFPRSP